MGQSKQRGSVLIEYIIILGFIAAIAVAFMSGDLIKATDEAMDRVVAIFDANSSSKNLLAGKSNAVSQKTFVGGQLTLNYNKIAIFGSLNEDGSCNLIELEPDTPYEIIIDIDKMKTGNSLSMDQPAELGIFMWGQSTNSTGTIYDSRDMSMAESKCFDYYLQSMHGSGAYVGTSVNAVLSPDGKTITYSFTTANTPSYMALALNYPSLNGDRAEIMAGLANNYQSFISLQKAK